MINLTYVLPVTTGQSLKTDLRFARSTDDGESGPLKNVGVKWRNATVRSTNFGSDLDENRLIVSYTLPIW